MSSPAEPPPLPPSSGQWAYPTNEKGEPKPKYVLWIVLGAAGCLVGIVVLGLLATIFIPQVVKSLHSAQRTATLAKLAELRAVLAAYAETHAGEYPSSLEALELAEPPRDPWGREFVYEPPSGGRSTPLLYSLGSDGQPGGDGDAADVHAWPQNTGGR